MTRVFYGILLLIIFLLAFGGCYTTIKTSSPQQDCYYRTTYERLHPNADVYVKRYKRTCDGDRFFFRENYRRYGDYYYDYDPLYRYQNGRRHWREKNDKDYRRQNDDRTYRPRRGTQGRSSGKDARRGDKSREERDVKRNGRKEPQTEDSGE